MSPSEFLEALVGVTVSLPGRSPISAWASQCRSLLWQGCSRLDFYIDSDSHYPSHLWHSYLPLTDQINQWGGKKIAHWLSSKPCHFVTSRGSEPFSSISLSVLHMVPYIHLENSFVFDSFFSPIRLWHILINTLKTDTEPTMVNSCFWKIQYPLLQNYPL